jgi:hypothetical protein
MLVTQVMAASLVLVDSMAILAWELAMEDSQWEAAAAAVNELKNRKELEGNLIAFRFLL